MYQKVRLSPKAIDVIIDAFKKNFSENDHLWVFGSRADLQAKGGDIDLYVETAMNDIDKVIKAKSKMVSQICRTIGEQKIDVVLNILSLNDSLEIYHTARENGIQLV